MSKKIVLEAFYISKKKCTKFVLTLLRSAKCEPTLVSDSCINYSFGCPSSTQPQEVPDVQKSRRNHWRGHSFKVNHRGSPDLRRRLIRSI